MQYARDNLDLDPGWHICKGCDRDGDFTPDADGLCPECAARKNMSERIWSHYDHAREKHPHFCDRLLPDWPKGKITSRVAVNLECARTRIKAGVRDHIFVRCEECRNHGKCKKERTAFKCYHVKGCFVEIEKPKR